MSRLMLDAIVPRGSDSTPEDFYIYGSHIPVHVGTPVMYIRGNYLEHKPTVRIGLIREKVCRGLTRGFRMDVALPLGLVEEWTEI